VRVELLTADHVRAIRPDRLQRDVAPVLGEVADWLPEVGAGYALLTDDGEVVAIGGVVWGVAEAPVAWLICAEGARAYRRAIVAGARVILELWRPRAAIDPARPVAQRFARRLGMRPTGRRWTEWPAPASGWQEWAVDDGR
jgi:hypothetical protein